MRAIPARPSSLVILLALAWMPLLGQEAASFPSEWEIRDTLNALVGETQRLKPMIEAIRPEQWAEQGAPDAYIAQRKSVLAEMDYLKRSADELAAEPDRLTKALETYFRTQSLEAFLSSLNEGVRRYQNPALADLVSGVMNRSAESREMLRRYLVQLAAAKEQQCKVMDEEAQRCRTGLSRQAPSRDNPARKTQDR